ncbi:MAG: hypothetical protein AAGJ10_12985 [Bacteroidota bacterium]
MHHATVHATYHKALELLPADMGDGNGADGSGPAQCTVADGVR